MSRVQVVSSTIVLVAASVLIASSQAAACTPQKCGGGGSDLGTSMSMSGIHTVEGTQVGPEIAWLVDQDPNATAAEYVATVSWGDGTPPATATVTPTTAAPPGTRLGPGVRFSIQATHAYADDGSYLLSVTVTDTDNHTGPTGAGGTVQVDEAAISTRGVTDALTNPYCDAVAGFWDANAAATSGEFTASIDWGDGTASPGTVSENTSGGPGSPKFWVNGCHTYADLGPHTVTTTIADSSYFVTATNTSWVYAPTDAGTFVIGDGNAAVGTNVTYSGPQWSAANAVSGGSTPNSFKGFVPGRSPICVGTWTAPPGDSAAAPATLPAYTAMLVSTSVTKRGDDIAGNSVHVALVRTDGTPGTGTIVFMIC